MNFRILLVTASFAHALSLPSGPGPVSITTDVSENAGSGSAEELYNTTSSPELPPQPQEELIRETAVLNKYYYSQEYDYPYWNVTDLDAESCREAVQLLNNQTRASEDGATCTPTYSCNFQQFRYPHWYVFANCTVQPCDPSDLSAGQCRARLEPVVMLHYEENGDDMPRGQWTSMFTYVPLSCKCFH